MKFLSFGEILFDIYKDEEIIGGAPFNIACHMGLLKNESYIISKVGKDLLGKKAIEYLSLFNVKSSFVSITDKKETGKCIVTLNDNKVPTYSLKDDVSYDYIDFPKINENFDVLSFGTLSLRHDYNRKTLLKIIENMDFKEIYCDINIRPPYYDKDSILLAIRNATILKVSDEEYPLLTKEIYGIYYDEASFISKLKSDFKNIKIILLTKGEKGAVCYFENKIIKENAVKTKVVSTVGAGDSFGAGFLNSYFKDNDIKKALKEGIELSSYVVSKKDAVFIK